MRIGESLGNSPCCTLAYPQSDEAMCSLCCIILLLYKSRQYSSYHTNMHTFINIISLGHSVRIVIKYVQSCYFQLSTPLVVNVLP